MKGCDSKTAFDDLLFDDSPFGDSAFGDLALDWSAYENSGFGDPYADIPKHGEDFSKAVAVCINSMQCLRPIDRGVMCPSYRVTGNPDHSPGGRVRLLKEALNASQPEQAMFAPDLVEAMALCVSCKGCKRECDSNVDMAALKAEYLAQTAPSQRPLRERIFSSLPLILKDHKSTLRILIKLRNRLRFAAVMGEKMFGISAKKTLPVPQKQSFYETQELRDLATQNYSKASDTTNKAQEPVSKAEQKQVLLLVDTFSNYFDPQIVRSAVNVLKYLGYEVYIHSLHNGANDRPLCCGRTYYANGDIDAARAEARRLLGGLAPMINNEVPIVGLEPSCLLMLRDEYKSMDLGPLAEQASKLALLFEEFLAKEQSAGRLAKEFQSAGDSGPLLVHGHCHEKSVGAMKSLRKLLKLVPDLDFEFIESSCCGGAGNFSFQAEHSELASEMAELALMPAIRSAPDATIISNGFSCRQQISDHSSRSSQHIASVLERYICTTDQ